MLHYTPDGTAFMLMFTSRLRLGPLGERWVADAPAIATIGLALTTVGALLAAWARVGLAANWSSSVAIQRDHMLIRGGPYVFLRHPIYAGLLVALLGTALVLGEVRGLAAVALAVIAWGWKSRQEDAILLRRFGRSTSGIVAKCARSFPFCGSPMPRSVSVNTAAREIEADLRVIREILRRPFDADIARGGLTGPQVSVLRAVVGRGPLRINDLSEDLKLAHSTLSVMITRLVERGLLSRQSDPDDRRAVRIDVTAPVRKYVQQTLPRRRLDPLVAALRTATARDRRLIGTGVRRLRRLLERRGAR